MLMFKVLVVGLGPIGVSCAQAVQAESDWELAGLIDADPAKIGLTLADWDDGHAAKTGPPGPTVTNSIAKAIAGSGADVALVTTTSHFDQVAHTISSLIEQKIPTVSTCEQMAWPWYRHPELAKRIHDQAFQAGVAVLGTGINPGFVMDTLAVCLSSMVRQVQTVRCVRRVDVGRRRQPLQAKVGATMTPQCFRSLAREGKVGHVGLAESVAMIAAGLGRCAAPGSVQVTLEPKLADRPINFSPGIDRARSRGGYSPRGPLVR